MVGSSGPLAGCSSARCRAGREPRRATFDRRDHLMFGRARRSLIYMDGRGQSSRQLMSGPPLLDQMMDCGKDGPVDRWSTDLPQLESADDVGLEEPPSEEGGDEGTDCDPRCQRVCRGGSSGNFVGKNVGSGVSRSRLS